MSWGVGRSVRLTFHLEVRGPEARFWKLRADRATRTMLRADGGEPGSGDSSRETPSLGVGCGEPLPDATWPPRRPQKCRNLFKLPKTAAFGATPQSKQYWS